MSKSINEITEKNLSYILNNPWKFTNYEWKLHNKYNVQTALDQITERVELTRKGGFAKIWYTQHNLPLVIFMAFKVSDTKLECYLVASKHMEEDDQALKVTFDMRKVLEEQSYNYKGCTLAVYSQSREIDKQMSWLRFIGFKYMPEGNVGNSRYFEYVSRA